MHNNDDGVEGRSLRETVCGTSVDSAHMSAAQLGSGANTSVAQQWASSQRRFPGLSNITQERVLKLSLMLIGYPDMSVLVKIGC